MSKIHRRHNWKGRQIVNTLIDKSEQDKIKVDLNEDSFKYDECNALVLPSSKRRTKKLKDKKAPPVKLLSKRQRKHLEKVVDQKRKKACRAELISALEEVQAKPKELEHLLPLQTAQTLGRKKFILQEIELRQIDESSWNPATINIIKGGGLKRKRHLSREKTPEDGSVIQLGECSSSSCESDSDDSVIEETKEVPIIEIEKDIEGSSMEEITVSQPNEQSDSKTTDPPTEQSETQRWSEEKITEEKKASVTTKAVFRILNRVPEIQKERLRLPILSEEHAVMEAISEHPVVVVVGPTGSGKTTQVPQFLYEAGYTENGMMIGVTEPRRVAAISVSQRVCDEMNLSSDEVSYQIRFEGNTSPQTKIKFMTDGVLLKEIQTDPSLKKYSAIIIDEAHERSVYSDILIGILSRVIPRREATGKPLKLVIMSATLRIEDFTDNDRLFKKAKPPVVKIDSRVFDVTIHFNKKTPEDYLCVAYQKVCKIHRQLPDGGILVFLTGQQEVNTLCRKLRQTFPDDQDLSGGIIMTNFQRKTLEHREERKTWKERDKSKVPLPKIDLSSFLHPKLPEAMKEISSDIASSGLLDDEDADGDLYEGEDMLEEYEHLKGTGPEQPLWVLPLYSMLPSDKQKLIFEPPPEGKRLCVVATNVAETSLTIPNIKYIVDCGRVKEKVYDTVTGISMFHITWTSQASANQRAGRAGRTAPGHCYRLYSSAIFNDEFQAHTNAEILRRPIDDLVLVMKSMKLPVINFPFPTPPKHSQVMHSMKRLMALEALEERKDLSIPCKKRKLPNIKDVTVVITELGKSMAAFPLSPRYAKMLVISHQHPDLLPYVVLLVCALTVQEVLVETPFGEQDSSNESIKRWQVLRLAWLGSGQSRLLGDLMILLKAILAAEYSRASRESCESNGLRYKAITEIRKLRRQLTNEINLVAPGINLTIDPKLKPPTSDQVLLLRQIVLAGSVDHIAKKVDTSLINDPIERRKWKNSYQMSESEEPVFLISTSPLRINAPEWVTYQDIYQTNKMFMRGVTAIEPKWLPIFASKMCSFNQKVLEEPPPRYDVEEDQIVCHRSATFGLSSWVLPNIELGYPESNTEIGIYAWMAFFFLAGDICPLLKCFSEQLYEIKTLVSRFAFRFRERRENLLVALKIENIKSLSRLKEVWKTNPKYLLKEYLAWLKDDQLEKKVIDIWPPIEDR